jgi:hypothetical protein
MITELGARRLQGAWIRIHDNFYAYTKEVAR